MQSERVLIRIAEITAKKGSSWLMRRVLSRFSQWAERRFKALREPLAGIIEQATEGTVNAAVMSQLALRLEWLDVWLRGIRGERATKMVGSEADYLHRCSGADNGLELARRKFPKDGPQEWRCRTDSQGEFMGDKYRQDQLAWHCEQLGSNRAK